MFISLRSRIRQVVLLGCVSGAALLVPALGQASAATYPNGGSTFTGSAEGWKVAATPEKSCKLLGLANVEILCSIDGNYDATAGAPAGSYAVTANIPLNLITVFNGNLTAESPAFTAAGSGTGTLSLAREFDPKGVLQGLLNIIPQFTYNAYLVDKTTNTKQKAITETIGTEVPFGTKTGSVSLTAGHNYVIQIETSYTATISLGLLEGTATGRFDNVSVTGPDGSGNPGENPGGNGNNGSDGGNGGEGSGGGNGANGGAGGVSGARLESLLSSSLVGPAVLKGNRLSVKAKCPAKVGVTCTISLQGMLNRHKPATVGRKAKVKKGKTKSYKLAVKPAARKAVKSKTKLLFKETVKAGSAKATVWKTLKLVRK